MASTDVLVHINMNGNEIQNVLAQRLATAPSNPSAGQFYFNTNDNTLYVYDGTTWKNALAQGTTYQAGTGIDSTSLAAGTIAVSTTVASKTDIGSANLTIQRNGTGIGTFSANATSPTTVNISVPTTATDIGAVPTSRTINGKSLTANVTLTAADVSALPSNTVIGDADITIQRNGTAIGTINANQTSAGTINISVPTTATEVGALPDSTVIGDGKTIFKKNGTAFATITANQTGTINVNYTIPTQASDIGALPDSTVIGSANYVIQKNGIGIGTIGVNSTTGGTINVTAMEKTDISIASGSTNYLDYNSSTGAISANVDTSVVASSTNLITSGAVQSAISGAISTVYKAAGSVAFASLPTLGSSVEGNVYNITDNFTTTSDFVEGAGKSYPAGTNVVCINTTGTTYKWDVLAASIDTSAFITSSSTNTLTNKTIDADDNTISDLTTSNFKSGTLQTTVRASATASDTAIPTEKAVRMAITNALDSYYVLEPYSVNNPALTSTNGQCVWTIQASGSISIDDIMSVEVYNTSTNAKVLAKVELNASTIVITLNSNSNIAASAFKAKFINYVV
ncbi:MAG: hypothetical protein II244_05990 [Clostridia bacterium]|nr:hypothetical protein [Clostridia bacterium]